MICNLRVPLTGSPHPFAVVKSRFAEDCGFSGRVGLGEKDNIDNVKIEICFQEPESSAESRLPRTGWGSDGNG